MTTNQPIYILPDDSNRTTGKNAQQLNIQAAILVADSIRTTLGPKGMDKMLVDNYGEITVTNDGVTILQEMNIEHPSAKMIVEIAKTQENEVGDGTTTAVILAGEILKNSETLLEQSIHPTILTKGINIASKKAIEILDEISLPLKDDETLKNIAMTAMTGKGVEFSKEKLSDIIVKAIKLIKNEELDPNNIKFEKNIEGNVDNTELIEGILLDKEKVHSSMPSNINNAKIALITSSLELKSTEIDAKIQINNPSEIQSYLEHEENILRKMVEKIDKEGANVVICQKGIDDIAQHFLAKKGIYAIRRVNKEDIIRISKATKAKIVSDIHDLNKEDLGFAGLVEQKKLGNEFMTYIKDCKDPKAVTILIKGGSEHIVSEVKRALEDALGDLITIIKNNKFVGGAGSTETELSIRLNEFSKNFSGKEQLVIQAFAKSLEIIPKTLSENAGLDPIDILTNLKSSHNNGLIWSGINSFSGEIIDSLKNGIIEPLKVKTQAISSAAEVAIMILRIDDIIFAGKQEIKPENQDYNH